MSCETEYDGIRILLFSRFHWSWFDPVAGPSSSGQRSKVVMSRSRRWICSVIWATKCADWNFKRWTLQSRNVQHQSMSSFTFVLALKETQRSCIQSEMCLEIYFCPRVRNWCQLSSALRTQQQRFFAEAPEDSTFAHSGTKNQKLLKKPSWKMSWSKSWVEALLATASGCLSSTHIQTPRTGRSSGSRGPPSALSFQCRLLISNALAQKGFRNQNSELFNTMIQIEATFLVFPEWNIVTFSSSKTCSSETQNHTL